MSEVCRLVHEKLAQLPLVKSPFDADKLPFTGIYFFYESGEVWGHGSKHDRIVRTGSSKPGNLRSRIKEHYLLDERKMDFDRGAPKPSDRSIFRKNIGRALLNRDGDDYLRLWDVDFTTRKNRDQFAHLRDMDKERALEAEITRILRCRFSFRFITMEGEAVTMGRKGLEGFIIGTLGSCRLCAPSDRDSPYDVPGLGLAPRVESWRLAPFWDRHPFFP